MKIEPSTVGSRLNAMAKQGKIEWVRASTSKPLMPLLSVEDVPQRSFDRLDLKAKTAEADLQLVEDYTNVADDEKHNFLEQHLNR